MTTIILYNSGAHFCLSFDVVPCFFDEVFQCSCQTLKNLRTRAVVGKKKDFESKAVSFILRVVFVTIQLLQRHSPMKYPGHTGVHTSYHLLQCTTTSFHGTVSRFFILSASLQSLHRLDTRLEYLRLDSLLPQLPLSVRCTSQGLLLDGLVTGRTVIEMWLHKT